MIGALLAGWEQIVGIEQDASYVALAEQRLEWWRTQSQPSLWPGATLQSSAVRPPVQGSLPAPPGPQAPRAVQQRLFS